MDINRANMTEFFQQVRAEFTAGFNATQDTSLLGKIATQVSTNTKSTVHGWLNQMPKMREWVGDRVVRNIESNSLTIQNRKFELTIDIPREDIEDDNYGLYSPVFNAAGIEAASMPMELCYSALLKGTSTLWADGTAFFSDSRTYGENTIDNYSTSELTVDTFNAAYLAMTSYLGHNNKPLRARPAYLICGPENRKTAFQVLEDMYISREASTADGVQGMNYNKGIVEPIISEMLVDGIEVDGTTYNAAGYWFLLGDFAGIKGIVYQQRMAPELQTQKWSPDSEYTFNTDNFQIGARMRGEAFLALPHLIYANLAS